jgi:hypothetical protein
MRDCNTEFDETSVDKSNTPESDTTINNTSGVNNEEDKSVFESRPRKNPLPCMNSELRDRPFNLKGRGVMFFCFVQNFFFGQHKI